MNHEQELAHVAILDLMSTTARVSCLHVESSCPIPLALNLLGIPGSF